jgi:type II pantothenate kinase
MGVIIGIDIGGSRTKIVGIDKGEVIEPLLVKAADPVTSLFGALGKYVTRRDLELKDIERIMLTGVGSSYIEKPIYGLPTIKVDEFIANGLGGLYLSGLQNAAIVSMGTGTAIVVARGDKIEHVGGTGVGGGTISGLCRQMLNMTDLSTIIEEAEKGNLAHVDLTVGDIAMRMPKKLNPTTTASNFGKISDLTTKSDVALGILNLVFQVIGTTAAFSIMHTDIRDIVLIGRLTTIPQCADLFKQLGDLHNINFVIPNYSAFGTAFGAVLYEK